MGTMQVDLKICWQEVEVVSIRWFLFSLKRMNKKERIQGHLKREKKDLKGCLQICGKQTILEKYGNFQTMLSPVE